MRATQESLYPAFLTKTLIFKKCCNVWCSATDLQLKICCLHKCLWYLALSWLDFPLKTLQRYGDVIKIDTSDRELCSFDGCQPYICATLVFGAKVQLAQRVISYELTSLQLIFPTRLTYGIQRRLTMQPKSCVCAGRNTRNCITTKVPCAKSNLINDDSNSGIVRSQFSRRRIILQSWYVYHCLVFKYEPCAR